MEAVTSARRAMSTAYVSLPSTMLLRRHRAHDQLARLFGARSPRMQTFTIYRYDPDEVGAKPKYQDYEINLDECGPMVRAPCTPQRRAPSRANPFGALLAVRGTAGAHPRALRRFLMR